MLVISNATTSFFRALPPEDLRYSQQDQCCRNCQRTNFFPTSAQEMVADIQPIVCQDACLPLYLIHLRGSSYPTSSTLALHEASSISSGASINLECTMAFNSLEIHLPNMDSWPTISTPIGSINDHSQKRLNERKFDTMLMQHRIEKLNTL